MATPAALQSEKKLDRTSQASRISPGRPGSRRFQRFLNEELLKARLAANLDPDEIRSLFQPSYHSSFEDLFDANLHPDLLRAIRRGMCAEEDRSRRMRGENRTVDPSDCFKRYLSIPRPERAVFRRSIPTQFLEMVEGELQAFTVAGGPELVLGPYDDFQRLITHAAATYYGLQSKSEGEGQARLIRVRAKLNWPPPAVPLAVLLSQL
eukprot:tig00021463_g21629.t1